jgi:hypothetical protein
MRTVGQRQEPPIASEPSGRLLAATARAMEALRKLPGGDVAFIPKGVYVFATLEEADRHRDECQARAMAELARNRA